jgi:excisionase family DNA binding protein
MDLNEILTTEKEVKLVVNLQDMISLVDYILQNRFINTDQVILNQEFGGVEFAMKITGLARSTIYNKCSKGELPHHKNGKLFFSKQKLEEWMRSKSNEEEFDITEHMK